jgi:dGTPase
MSAACHATAKRLSGLGQVAPHLDKYPLFSRIAVAECISLWYNEKNCTDRRIHMEIVIAEKSAISKEIVANVNNLPKRRPHFMRDRDQIFYSRSFRRLAGKTQLLAVGKDEILRTRLTHTLEVSQIARTIGQALKLDLDLIEAIVLGHDLGHTPFGHVGERTLHEIMTPDPRHVLGKKCPLCAQPEATAEKWGEFLGFKHNLQSLVVTMELEQNARGRGLGLTKYTLYGLQAHTKPSYKKGRMKNHDMLGYYGKYLKNGAKDAWSLEALLVAQADEIAQWHHDLEDALLEGLITPAEIVKVMEPMLRLSGRKLTAQAQNVLDTPENYDLESFTYVFTGIVVETLMEKLVETAGENIRALGGTAQVPVLSQLKTKMAHVVPVTLDQAKDIFSYGDKKVEGSFAEAVEAFPNRIGGILGAKSIRNADKQGEMIIKKLFSAYYQKPEKLPDECVFAYLGACHELEKGEDRDAYEQKLREDFAVNGMAPIRELFRKKLKSRGKYAKLEKLVLMRTICNHIASMTDSDARRAAKKI